MSKRYGRHNTSLIAFNAPDLRIRFTSIDDNVDQNYTLLLHQYLKNQPAIVVLFT